MMVSWTMQRMALMNSRFSRPRPSIMESMPEWDQEKEETLLSDQGTVFLRFRSGSLTMVDNALCSSCGDGMRTVDDDQDRSNGDMVPLQLDHGLCVAFALVA